MLEVLNNHTVQSIACGWKRVAKLRELACW
jgi:hypothetical protein